MDLPIMNAWGQGSVQSAKEQNDLRLRDSSANGFSWCVALTELSRQLGRTGQSVDWIQYPLFCRRMCSSILYPRSSGSIPDPLFLFQLFQSLSPLHSLCFPSSLSTFQMTNVAICVTNLKFISFYFYSSVFLFFWLFFVREISSDHHHFSSPIICNLCICQCALLLSYSSFIPHFQFHLHPCSSLLDYDCLRFSCFCS